MPAVALSVGRRGRLPRDTKVRPWLWMCGVRCCYEVSESVKNKQREEKLLSGRYPRKARACVCVCVCVRACVCARACMCACAHMRARARVHVCVCV